MDDSIRYLLDLAILLFAAKVFSTAGKKIGMPEVVGVRREGQRHERDGQRDRRGDDGI